MAADKVAFVTGAGGDIGQALCVQLARLGYRMGLLSRTAAKVEATGEQLNQARVPHAVALCDLRDRQAVAKATCCLSSQLGPPDVVIQNAGVGLITNPVAPNLAEMADMIQVNYLGCVYLLEAVLPGMLERGTGHFAAISTLGAYRCPPWSAAYAASKSAMSVYLESLRPALRRRGVQVSIIYLGFVRTAMSMSLPVRMPIWMLTPQSAAQKIVRAVLRGKREAAIPWYDAMLAKMFRQVPTWAYDISVNWMGRFIAPPKQPVETHAPTCHL
ncbi:MAG: SDR family NAD(P)-dependent oxidoreductase [Gemmataceae bacterium]